MIPFMPNEGLAIKLAAGARAQLEQWESAQGTPQQVALRCRVVLAALAGEDNVSIAQELGVSRPTVQLWRKRVHEGGIGEVWKIAPGRGRKPKFALSPPRTSSPFQARGATPPSKQARKGPTPSEFGVARLLVCD